MSQQRPSVRLRRLIRRRQRQAGKASVQAERLVERYFFGRFGRLANVRRFVVAWVLLIVVLIGVVVAQNSILSGYYQSEQPVPGGIYREGIVGTFGNANPIYASSEVDTTVSRLIFAGLFTYDNNNQLVGNLAKDWKLDQTGQVYTITLRPNLTWQDGEPLTAHDVAFTYSVIQNPDAESPFRANWTGISVEATDDRTVVFTLPNPLSSFLSNLTNGIVPRHLLKDIPMTGLRSAPFNSQAPIGSGQFQWHDVALSGHSPADLQQRIGLLPFDNYWRGAPKLKTLIVHVFANKPDMLDAYRDNQLTAMAGLNAVPSDIARQPATRIYNFKLTAANMVFFKTSAGPLKDKTLRQALVYASMPQDILSQLPYPTNPVREPFLSDQFAYNAKYTQKTDQLQKAKDMLTKAGWKVADDGMRYKKGKPLVVSITAATTPENRMIVAQLERQWGKAGVDVVPNLADDESFRSSLLSHEYDAIVYGITIGADPDVFVYWDSSQNDIRSENRLNLSEYESTTADTALEAGRTRIGNALRKIKYEPFLKAWQDDAPALGLYQPRFLYVTRGEVYNLQERTINTSIDRFNNVYEWMIRTAQVTNEK